MADDLVVSVGRDGGAGTERDHASLMLVAPPAGAMADMFDRRKVALAGPWFACAMAAALTAPAGIGPVTPLLLLAFCCLIGVEVAFDNPA